MFLAPLCACRRGLKGFLGSVLGIQGYLGSTGVSWVWVIKQKIYLRYSAALVCLPPLGGDSVRYTAKSCAGREGVRVHSTSAHAVVTQVTLEEL